MSGSKSYIMLTNNRFIKDDIDLKIKFRSSFKILLPKEKSIIDTTSHEII